MKLLDPLMDEGGEWLWTQMTEAPLAGWEQVRVVFGDSSAELRVVVAMFDSAGRPGAVSDLIATDGGRRQESVGARVEPDGRVQGTHWDTDGDQHTPRPLTETECSGLLELARALRARKGAC